MFAELDDDEDVAPPVSPVVHVTSGAVEAASCFLNFVAAEAPKYSCVPAAFCLAASDSNSVNVARSPIPLFNIVLALASAFQAASFEVPPS